MPNLTVSIPAGAIATEIGQIALAWWHARHDADTPLPATPTALAAAQEMTKEYLRAVLRQSRVNAAAATAATTIATADTQAVADAGGIT